MDGPLPMGTRLLERTPPCHLPTSVQVTGKTGDGSDSVASSPVPSNLAHRPRLALAAPIPRSSACPPASRSSSRRASTTARSATPPSVPTAPSRPAHPAMPSSTCPASANGRPARSRARPKGPACCARTTPRSPATTSAASGDVPGARDATSASSQSLPSTRAGAERWRRRVRSDPLPRPRSRTPAPSPAVGSKRPGTSQTARSSTPTDVTTPARSNATRAPALPAPSSSGAAATAASSKKPGPALRSSPPPRPDRRTLHSSTRSRKRFSRATVRAARSCPAASTSANGPAIRDRAGTATSNGRSGATAARSCGRTKSALKPCRAPTSILVPERPARSSAWTAEADGWASLRARSPSRAPGSTIVASTLATVRRRFWTRRVILTTPPRSVPALSRPNRSPLALAAKSPSLRCPPSHVEPAPTRSRPVRLAALALFWTAPTPVPSPATKVPAAPAANRSPRRAAAATTRPSDPAPKSPACAATLATRRSRSAAKGSVEHSVGAESTSARGGAARSRSWRA